MQRIVALGVGLGLILTLALAADAATPPEAPLTEGSVVVREIAAGESQHFRMALAAGDFVRLSVEPPALSAVIVSAPDGGPLVQMIRRSADATSAELRVVAEQAGDYDVELRAATQSGTRYTLRVEERRAATEDDRTRFTAERLFHEAKALLEKRGPENIRRARTLLLQSLEICRSIDDAWWTGNVLVDLGYAHRLLAEHDAALNYYQQSLPEQRRAKNAWGEAAALNNIAAIYQSRGEMARSLEFLNQSLAVVEAAGDLDAVRIVTGNIGVQHLSQGDFQAALDSLDRARALSERIGEKPGLVRTLINLAAAFRLLGDADTAYTHAQNALSLAEALGDRYLQATSLSTLAHLDRLRGGADFGAARLQKALLILRELGDRSFEGAVLSNLGQLHLDRGELEEARRHLDAALATLRSAEERLREANVLRLLGRTSLAAQDAPKAMEYFGESLQIERGIGNRDGEAEALADLAKAEQHRGDVRRALGHSAAALEIVESTRGRVASPDLRASYLSSKRPFYELQVDLLMRMGDAPAAIGVSERALARSLVDLLGESRLTVRKGVDPTLREREQALGEKVNALETTRLRLLGSKQAAAQLPRVRDDLEAAIAQYRDLQAQIRKQSPEYAALTQIDPVAVRSIQSELDHDTVALEYLLGEGRSHLWVVDQDRVIGHELPARAVIEGLARSVHAELAAYGRERAIAGGNRAEREAKSRAEIETRLRELAKVVLAPAQAALTRKRIVVVPDGALAYVPFAALTLPMNGAAFRPLGLDHEIVSVPSFSALAAIRSTPARPAPAGSVAVLADPVFEAADVRVAGKRPARAEVLPSPAAPVTPLGRAAHDAGVTRFRRLRFSRQEAEQIAALAGAASHLKHLDFAASRAAVLDPRVRSHRVLHLATHGLLNTHHPELSGIVLSLVDDKGAPQEGFLRLHDIYNLELGADLVVLSACQTALGKEIKGEGLVGLTRGFMYAGAPRVVASLWNVEDRATAELMGHFYQALLKKRLAPAAALREAQRALAEDRRWSHPYYWAAFVLQGEWR